MPGDQSQAENERSKRMTEIEAWKEGDIAKVDGKKLLGVPRINFFNRLDKVPYLFLPLNYKPLIANSIDEGLKYRRLPNEWNAEHYGRP